MPSAFARAGAVLAALLAAVTCGVAPTASAAIRPADDPALTLTPAAIGTTLIGGVGAPYASTAPYTVSGGSGQVSWSDSGLPPGLSADSTSGAITGTPTVPGSYPVTVTIDDVDGQTQSATATFDIDPIGLATASGSPSYVVAIKGQKVATAPVVATGDTYGLTWSASGLPKGLSLDKSSGTLTGKPSTVGGTVTRFSVTNESGNRASLSVLFEVVVGYTCNYHEAGRVGRSLTMNCGVFWSTSPNHGGRWLRLPGKLGYSATGLPAGLRINASSGVISGTPRRAGAHTVTVAVDVRPDGVLVTGPVVWKSEVRCVVKT